MVSLRVEHSVAQSRFLVLELQSDRMLIHLQQSASGSLTSNTKLEDPSCEDMGYHVVSSNADVMTMLSMQPLYTPQLIR